VIDVVAADAPDLLEQLDGRRVAVRGTRVTLHTAGADIRDVPMTASEGLLSRLAHPAVALLLLTIGVNAILIEFSHPGGYVAGIAGVLALVLGFYSLGVLEANLIGLAFLAAAFAMFALEIKSPTHGLPTAAGIGLFVAGAVVLFSGGAYGVPWGTIIVLAASSAALLAFVVASVRRAMHRRPVAGPEALPGTRGRVVRTVAPTGKVSVLGEIWDAESGDGEQLEVGAAIKVVAVDRLTLTVRRAE
jgi:membrane-bound serine protease (ClpP class)